MKKRIGALALLLVLVLTFAACGKKTNGGYTVVVPSDAHYSEQDIRAAMRVAVRHFEKEFDGCKLLSICYDESKVKDAEPEWAAQYDADEAIVLLSSFHVDGSGGDGPFTPTRMGSMAVTDVIKYLFDRPIDEVKKLCSQGGGFSSWFGTSNADTVHALVESGDKKAALIWRAMIYQITKQIGAMACVLQGKVDAIVLTGGLMRFDDITDGIRESCGWIAPIAVYPGELEHEAMRDGALRVLRGEEEAKHYTGVPVFTGFDFME